MTFQWLHRTRWHFNCEVIFEVLYRSQRFTDHIHRKQANLVGLINDLLILIGRSRDVLGRIRDSFSSSIFWMTSGSCWSLASSVVIASHEVLSSRLLVWPLAATMSGRDKFSNVTHRWISLARDVQDSLSLRTCACRAWSASPRFAIVTWTWRFSMKAARVDASCRIEAL